MKKHEEISLTCRSCKSTTKLQSDSLLDLRENPLCPSCEKPLFEDFEAPLLGLTADCYIHGLDRDMLAALQKIPGIDSLLKTLIKHSFELSLRLYHQGNFIQVSENQFKNLFELLLLAQKRLDLHFTPELYIFQDPKPNAYTFGVEKSFVAVSTGCLELFTDEELLCVLAHELGHIQANHVLYKTASRIFGSIAGTVAQATFGLGSFVLYPLQMALLRWDRASELSSDRAALLVVKNPSIVLRTLMKLAGGTSLFAHELNIDAFIEQANAYEKTQGEGPLGRYIAIFGSLFRSHPFPIWRAKELIEWVKQGDYVSILQGDYLHKSLKAQDLCPICQKPISGSSPICEICDAETDNSVKAEEEPVMDGDPVGKAIKDVQAWYKKNFTLGDGKNNN